MTEAFEKIKVRLEELFCGEYDTEYIKKDSVLSIVSEVEAEYGKGWIPCNRADHPYDGQRVLACINTRIATHEIIITDYNGEIYWFDGTISAWMPLPEPYKPTND